MDVIGTDRIHRSDLRPADGAQFLGAPEQVSIRANLNRCPKGIFQMSRRKRPSEARRSEHWLRMAVNERQEMLNGHISAKFDWDPSEQIIWLSPVASDSYPEYFDQDFLNRLGVRQLKVPLNDFWPPNGPRWTALPRPDQESSSLSRRRRISTRRSTLVGCAESMHS